MGGKVMKETDTKRGKLIVFSAPSGAGKTTIVRRVLELGLPLNFSISATSRLPRATEKDGVDYFFLNVSDFKKRIKNQEFIEWEEVYENQFYGSLHSEVDKMLNEGKHVLFDIDVKGGLSIKKLYENQALTIFILPPSIQELENRLKIRGTEDDESFKKRIDKAEEEISQAQLFDIRIVNEELERAVHEVFTIIQKFISQ